nr:hypothetical protein A4A49_10332 [Ipomoea trifida]
MKPTIRRLAVTELRRLAVAELCRRGDEKQERGLCSKTQEHWQNFSAAAVTSHIQLKQPANSGDTLDKDVVLWRIRHRRRVNRDNKQSFSGLRVILFL